MDVLPSKSLGVSSAFVLGLLLGVPVSGLVASGRASTTGVTNEQLTQTLATMNMRMEALEHPDAFREVSQNYRVAIPGSRPAGIQVTAPQGPDALTTLQARVTSLENSLFGTTAPGGRPKEIKSDVIGGMEQQIDGLEKQIEQLKSTTNDNSSKLGSIRNDLASIHASSDATAKTVVSTTNSLNKLQFAFANHQHRLNGARVYQFPVGGVMRFFPGTQGEDPTFTLQPYCGGYPDFPKCQLYGE